MSSVTQLKETKRKKVEENLSFMKLGTLEQNQHRMLGRTFEAHNSIDSKWISMP